MKKISNYNERSQKKKKKQVNYSFSDSISIRAKIEIMFFLVRKMKQVRGISEFHIYRTFVRIA